MKKIMKQKAHFRKFIAASVILLLLYSTCGYIFVYQQLILLNRHMVNLAIEKNEVDHQTVLLSFKKSDIENKAIDFTWKHKKEFRFNGEMYDIVERAETADSVFFECIHDKKEKELEAGFIKHFEGEDEKNNQSAPSNSLVKIKFPDLFFDNYSLNTGSTQQQEYLIYFSGKYISPVRDVPAPPPKSFS